jgi:4-alpha-glucanotransferase
MPSESFEQLLERAASAHGISDGYWDIWGRHHHTPAEIKQVILRAKGVDASSAETLERWWTDRFRQEWTRLAPPCLVVAQTSDIRLPLHLPAESGDELAHLVVRTEDGSRWETAVNLREASQTGSAEVDGAIWVRKQVQVPMALPLGYHEIEVKAGSRSAFVRYIVTPDRAWLPPHLAHGGRLAGVTMSLYGVRSKRNWGCGDFTDLQALLDWAAHDLKASFLGLNPLHAIHNRRPFNTSPYLPNCIFYQNFLYLDVEAMEDFAQSRRAQGLFEKPEIQAEISQLREAPFVEYERVAALKLRFLKLAFLQFLREWRRDTGRARQFRAFLEREGVLLERFATYCALDEWLHRLDPAVWVWTEWPAPYQSPDSPETSEFRKKHWRSVLFYQYLQWQIDLQLDRVQQRARQRGMIIGLYHDLALATDRFGSDLWAHRPFFVNGCRVGSPPDDFAPKGQDWGFPPPNSLRHYEDGYRLFADSVRKNCRHGGALRIDHVMRLFRLYWIPDDRDATQGTYVREINDDFIRVLALESVRNQVVIVGEDLGTVEPEVRETLARFGILSYRLFYFEKDGSGRFKRNDEYPSQALVSSTTHDLPTLAGFWTGADIEARRAAGMLDDAGFQAQSQARALEKQKMLDVLFALQLLPSHLPRMAGDYSELTGELHNAVVGFLAGTPCQLLAINQEDLTKELAQQNLPGATWQYPNWSRKMRFTVEELRTDPEACAYTAMFRNWIVRSGRSNPSGEVAGAG